MQIYQADQSALCRNVGQYIWNGLRRGDGVLVVATAEHRKLFTEHLVSRGMDTKAFVETSRLVMLDAPQTLSRFMIGAQPDWHRFEAVIREAIHRVRPAAGSEGLRAYGEMVGILWKRRQFAAAIRLEQLWNKVMEQSVFNLYCAYALDLFGSDFEMSQLESVLCTHTHLLPSDPDGSLEAALNRSLDEILGPEADNLRLRIKAHHRSSWAVMANVESAVLWLRRYLPEKAEEIVSRARNYQALQRESVS